MDHSRSFSSLPSAYNSFLFALICKEFNGAPLSVLSALARMNLDPWDEAARLGAMRQADATSSLSSMLNRIPGAGWKASAVDGIAAQLVQLLPDASAANSKTVSAAPRTLPTRFWLILLTVALAASFLLPHRQAIDTAASTSNSAQTSATGDGGTVPAETRPLVGAETRASAR